MKPMMTEAIIETHLSTIHDVIAEAASSSAAAMACLNDGDQRRAFRIALDIEPLLEADNLLQACSILRRRLSSSNE